MTGVTDMPIEIVSYDPAWPLRFEAERRLLEPVLAEVQSGPIHHIGSTAVPGLAAKPVIDLAVGVRDLAAARRAVPELAELGYRLWESDPRPWGLWFLKPEPRHRTHHLHLIEHDHAELMAKLAFRDRLRRDRQLRADYEALKRRLATVHRHDRQAYTEAKTAFVRSALTPSTRIGR